MTNEHDERRPGVAPEDLAVARARARLVRRVWAVAVEARGMSWANQLGVGFTEDGTYTLSHPDASGLTELRAHLARDGARP